MAVCDLGRPYLIRERDYKSYPHLICDEVVIIPTKITATFVFCDVHWNGDINPMVPYLKNEKFYAHHLRQAELKDNDALIVSLFALWKLTY